MTEAPRRRRWLFRLLAAVGGPLVFFLLLEGGLRVAGAGFDGRFWTPLPDRPALTSNPYFGWRFFPRAQARRPLAQDVASARPVGVRRVVVLGGSAAMGIPDPAFSFGRVLAVMLEQSADAAGSVELVNAAMTAVDSHVVRQIAGELHRLEPDAVLVYMGNNEVVGPFGAGRGEGLAAPPLFALRASMPLSRTRTGQLLAALLRPEPRRGEGWRGMEAFAEHRILPDDPRLSRVYGHFADNLRDIIRRARATGADVLVSTVAVDLLSTAPFASAAAGDREDELGAQLDQARSAITRGDAEAALDSAGEAVRVAPAHAEAHYRLGRAQALLGQREQALASLERARDLDALRFRADSEINRLIRTVTAEEGAVLVDSAAALARRSRLGAPGDELFFEHVHFTFAGAYEVARAFFLAWPRVPGETGPASLESCAEALGFSDWHRLGQLDDIVAMMARPPFVFQAGHGERMAQLRRERRLYERRLDAAAYDEIRRRLERALAARPDDIELRRSLAELLRSGGDGRAALRLLEPLLERLPGAPGLWLDAGNAALAAEDLEAARRAYETAVELDPHSPDGAFNLGALAVREQRYEDAMGHFSRVLELDGRHLEARLNLAAALDQLGSPDQALEEYRLAFELSPAEPVALHRLAAALEAGGQVDEAENLLERAVTLFPQDAKTQTEWARRLVRKGREQEAIRHFALALRLDPDSPGALSDLVGLHNRRAAELAAAGDLGGAITALNKALAASPDDAPTHFNLAMALGRAGRLEDAVRHLELARLEARRSGLEAVEREAESRLRALGRRPVERSAEN